MSKQFIINISSKEDTDPYLKILKKYNISLKRTYINKEDRVSAFTKELKKLTDEEASSKLRTPNKKLVEVLSTVLGQIENKRKSSGEKLTTPRAIMTFIQKEKERCINEDGAIGKVEAFCFNVLDTRMNNYHSVPLLPKTEFRKNVNPAIRSQVAEKLVDLILVDEKLPSEINAKEVANFLLKNSLADTKEELVIKLIQDLIN